MLGRRLSRDSGFCNLLQDFFSHSNVVEGGKDGREMINWAKVAANPKNYEGNLITGWFWGWRTECGIGDTVLCRFVSTVDVLSRAYGGDGELVLRMMKCKPIPDPDKSHCRVNKDSSATYQGRQPGRDGRLWHYIAREEAVKHSVERAKEWCGIAGYGNDCSDIKIRRRIYPK